MYIGLIMMGVYLTQIIDTANLYVDLEYRKSDASTVVANIHA